MSTFACSFNLDIASNVVIALLRSGCVIDIPSGTSLFALPNVTHTTSMSGSRTSFSHTSFASIIASSLKSDGIQSLLDYLVGIQPD